ncbi:MAG: hypothetical protein IPM29_05740 [Planctomycetes bacterium]|nr:hypothetical protein [Planctomycetota bacterium]
MGTEGRRERHLRGHGRGGLDERGSCDRLGEVVRARRSRTPDAPLLDELAQLLDHRTCLLELLAQLLQLGAEIGALRRATVDVDLLVALDDRRRRCRRGRRSRCGRCGGCRGTDRDRGRVRARRRAGHHGAHARDRRTVGRRGRKRARPHAGRLRVRLTERYGPVELEPAGRGAALGFGSGPRPLGSAGTLARHAGDALERGVAVAAVTGADLARLPLGLSTRALDLPAGLLGSPTHRLGLGLRTLDLRARLVERTADVALLRPAALLLGLRHPAGLLEPVLQLGAVLLDLGALCLEPLAQLGLAAP